MLPNWFRERGESCNFSRRSVLKLGTVGVLGMSLPECLAMTVRASSPGQSPAAKNVLVILEQGGLSHIDTWDPKPDAVADHRSPYKPIATRVPGMQFTELLPRTSLIADKLAVVRSFHHARDGADAHPNGTQYILSGSHPAAASVMMPDVGSVVSHLLGSSCRHLPPYIMVPGNHEQAAETRTGFLPAGTRVFKTGGRDVSDPTWSIPGITPRSELGEVRMSDRRRLQTNLAAAPHGPESQGMERFYDQAFDMLTSPRVSAVFDLKQEPAATRERYGQGHRGACYLMGRKLIEAGVRFVTIDPRWPTTPDTPRGTNLNWDHHDFIYANQTCELPGAGGGGAGRYGIGHWVMMGSVDRAYAALIDDLDQRGLLAETLVCFVTEFGRTPRLNRHQGRDHWTNAYSMVFAGAGIKGGQVIGGSDRDGGYVVEQPYTPENYASTVYEKLGINRAQPIYTSSNRPVFFAHGGEPIGALLT